MAGLWQRIRESFSRKKQQDTHRRSKRGRSLLLESLERRQTMAANITGIVYTDANDDGIKQPAEALLGNVTVQLFRDGGDGIFNNGGGDDVLVDTDVTPNAGPNLGTYALTAATTGLHFVFQQTAVTGQVQRTSQRVINVNVPSVTAAQVVSIDDFNTTTSLFTADTVGTNPNSATTTGINNAQTLGGVRDLHANAAVGALTVAANLAGSGQLDYGNSASGQGVYLATYDGDDTNAPNALGTGLGAGTNDFDMTVGGTATFMRIVIAAETNVNDATLTIRARDNDSVEVLANALVIPERANPTDPLLTMDILFSSFPVGFDPTQVGALQFEISNEDGQQLVIDNIGLFGDPVIPDQNLINLNAMTIGNLVFLDRNNDGTFNGADTGINGVDVRLYQDTDGDGVLDAAEIAAQPAPATTTTDANGLYSFTGLLPGSYIVLIPQSEFGTGQPLANHLSSPGAGPIDTNNEDQGAPSGTDGIAAAVILVAAAEPTDDGDTDNNTNLTVDFGFTNTVLTLTKTDSPDPVRVGDQLTYTLTATNNGPSNSTNTVITDTLPAGLTLVSASYSVNGGAAQNANNAAGTITTNNFDLSATQQTVLTIIATVGAGFVNNTNNTGSVQSTEVTTPVTANATTGLVPDIDLGISKTIVGGIQTIGLGETFSYRLTLTNNSNIAVTGIEVLDNLPANFNPGTLPAGVALDGATADPNDLIWSIATIAANATVSVDIPITVGANATLGETTNTATIDVSVTGLAGFRDTNVNNNTSSVDITVEPRYDLRVTKTNGINGVETGQTFTYTIQAINDGPSEATNVTLTDTLPSSLEFVSSLVGSAAGQVFTANIGSLASGATSAPVNVVVRVRSNATGTNVVNTASVSADNPARETNTGNNTATDTDPLTRTVTLTVTKNDSADPVVAGGANFSYIVTAFNAGTADTANAVFSDVLPVGIEFVSGTFTINEATPRTGNVTFDATTRTATANLGTLLPGSSTTNRAEITLVVRAAATAAAGTVTNTARLVSADNSTGVTDAETTTINRDFDVTVTKNDNNVDAVSPGQTYVYTIVVTNTGVSTATNITVSDPLPQHLTFQSATTGFTNAGGTVSGTIASLAAGASSTITISTTVNNDAPNGTVLNNTVTVTAAGESNTNNNTATASATVVTTANLTGRVYIDANRNGVFDAGEAGIAGVTINLSGTPTVGAAITRTATTDADGLYTFDALPLGTYTVQQVQPADFNSQATNVGTINGTPTGTGTENQIATITLTGNSINNNFGESQILSKRRFLASS